MQTPYKLPLKNVAASLLFAVFLGPVGLLYSSLLGGIVMIFFGFIVATSKFIIPIIIIWLISCIWSVAATNRYNKKIMDKWFNEKNNTSVPTIFPSTQ